MTVERVLIFVLIVVVVYLLVAVTQMRGELEHQTNVVAHLRRVVSQMTPGCVWMGEHVGARPRNERPRRQGRVDYNIPSSR